MLKTALAAIALTILVPTAVAGAATASGAASSGRGAVRGVKVVAVLSRAQAAKRLAATRLPAPRPKSGVVAYRLRYATVGVDGRPTSASALLVLPRDRRRKLRTIVYEHGTLVKRADAPSRFADFSSQAAVLYAGAGYAVVVPDYLGLGDGPGAQAYLHAGTEASASLDAVRAARTFALGHGRRLDPRLDVTGFSQGGQAAMAFGRALEQGADPQLRLRALAPVSGPYDLEHAEVPKILDGTLDPRISAFNVTALLLSWRAIYPLTPAPQATFTNAYAARIPVLFDGRHADERILAAMPTRLSRIFTPATLAAFRAPSGGLLAGMRENDTTCDWAPHARIHLWAAAGDRAVTIANSRSCITALKRHDVTAPLTDLGRSIDHFPSLFAATPNVLAWLQTTGS